LHLGRALHLGLLHLVGLGLRLRLGRLDLHLGGGHVVLVLGRGEAGLVNRRGGVGAGLLRVAGRQDTGYHCAVRGRVRMGRGDLRTDQSVGWRWEHVCRRRWEGLGMCLSASGANGLGRDAVSSSTGLALMLLLGRLLVQVRHGSVCACF